MLNITALCYSFKPTIYTFHAAQEPTIASSSKIFSSVDFWHQQGGDTLVL